MEKNDILPSLRAQIIELVPEINKYSIHEIHGEGGRTIDKQKLHWAKVREDSSIGIREVLMAMKAQKKHPPYPYADLVAIYWNLEKDNLNEQSDETIAFISDILKR